VRDFVVDHKGRHRGGELDLKRGGLLPVAALGRWVAVVTGDSRGGTRDRLRRGLDAGLLTADEADTLDAAFEQVYELLLRRDLVAVAAGAPLTTYVDPRELDTLTRRHLRETFRSIAAIQETVAGDWLARVRR
jgi:CBS domain-containing protein